MKSFKEKVANYWYYYKWHTLIVLFFAIVFIVLIVQMVSRPKFDIKVLYAGPVYISDTASAAVTDALGQLIPEDYDGNGEKKAELYDLLIMNEEQLKEADEKGELPPNISKINENRETLTVTSIAGEYLLYFIDISCYEDLKNNSVFVPRSEYGFDAGTAYDEYSVYLKSLDFAKFYTAFDVFPDTTLVCIKRVRHDEDGKGGLSDLQRQHIEFLKNAAAFVAPDSGANENTGDA